VSEQQAAAMAEEANHWHSLLAGLAPTAATFNLTTASAMVRRPDGETELVHLVRMIVGTPTGAFVVHIPADTAGQLADLLGKVAVQARTGLVTP
jgi:hypothetical protein